MHIELCSISKRFGRSMALDGVDLSIPPSSIIAVLGENGAGKSTLLRLLAGIYVADKGIVRFGGATFTRENLALRKSILFTPEVPLLFFDETVARNIATFAGLYDVNLSTRQEAMTHWLSDTGAAPLVRRTAGNLSRGQQWKAALACVAAADPAHWFVDEPFASGMDVAGMGAFRRLAKHLAANGGTVVYTTQMVDLAAGFSDHVCVLRGGRVVLWETSERIKERLAADPDGAEAILRGAPTQSQR